MNLSGIRVGSTTKHERKRINGLKNSTKGKPGVKYVSRCPVCVGDPTGFGVKADYVVNPLAQFVNCRNGHRWRLR